MSEIFSLVTTNNDEYLLGGGSDGVVYVWIFRELLASYFKCNYDG